jgi:hypothetical protein
MPFTPSSLIARIVVFFLITVFVSFQGYSQKVHKNGLSGGIDAGTGFKNGSYNPSITYYELVSIAKNEFLFVGWTGRLSTFYGKELSYYTAPARLTRGKSGLGSLSEPLRVDHIDTLTFNRLSQTSLNLGLRAEFYVGPITIGASVDLLGFTFLGRTRTGFIQSSTGLFTVTDSIGQQFQKPFQGEDAFQQATPHRLNLRLLGDNNRGMLTTEIYARVRLNEGVSLKVGYQWLTSEMVLKNADVVAKNDRFRNRSGLPYIGLTFPISPW